MHSVTMKAMPVVCPKFEDMFQVNLYALQNLEMEL